MSIITNKVRASSALLGRSLYSAIFLELFLSSSYVYQDCIHRATCDHALLHLLIIAIGWSRALNLCAVQIAMLEFQTHYMNFSKLKIIKPPECCPYIFVFSF